MMKRFPLVLLFVILAYNLSFPQNQAVRPRRVNIEPITLQGVDGKMYDLTALRGGVTLISFGATWCKPCSDELQALEELKKEYKGRPVNFYWVSVERPEEITDKRLKEYAKKHKLSFPVLRDPFKWSFMQFAQIVRLPMVVFFDQSGNFVAPKHVGFSIGDPDLYKQTMRTEIDKILAGQSSNARAAGTR